MRITKFLDRIGNEWDSMSPADQKFLTRLTYIEVAALTIGGIYFVRKSITERQRRKEMAAYRETLRRDNQAYLLNFGARMEQAAKTHRDQMKTILKNVDDKLEKGKSNELDKPWPQKVTDGINRNHK